MLTLCLGIHQAIFFQYSKSGKRIISSNILWPSLLFSPFYSYIQNEDKGKHTLTEFLNERVFWPVGCNPVLAPHPLTLCWLVWYRNTAGITVSIQDWRGHDWIQIPVHYYCNFLRLHRQIGERFLVALSMVPN